MGRSRLPRLLVTAALLAFAPWARADLASDAERVASSWAPSGSATRLAPVFLEYGRLKAIALPPSAYDAASPSCASVALLTERSTDFVARVDPIDMPKHRSSAPRAERSTSGLVEISRCGKEKAALARLSVELRVARGAMEIIVAEGARRAAPVTQILEERASGPLARLTDAGPKPSLEPLETRLARAEGRARREGAASIRTMPTSPGIDGRGVENLHAEAGCHTIELFAEAHNASSLDLDAEVRDLGTERILARDAGDSPDARLDFCVGARSSLQVSYRGAPGAERILLSSAASPIPTGIPEAFGPRARAGMAAALRRRRVPSTGASPPSSFLGVTGPTKIPVELEPGACYLAAVTASRGEMRFLTLSAEVDGKTSFDSNVGLFDGTAVSFCAERGPHALLEVDARGRAVAWVLSVWKTGSITLGEAR